MINILKRIRSLLLAACALALYPNNLKDREFGKEASQIFRPAQAAVLIDTARARDKKSGTKPTKPKIDSSGCLGIIRVNGEEKMEKIRQKFGTWPSPIGAELISQISQRFGSIAMDEGIVYWEEMRPLEGGRTAIVSELGDQIPREYSASSSVHEYGGKSFTVHQGVIYFINDKDQRIYVCKKEHISPLTETGPRFADLSYCETGLIAVREIHHSATQVENCLVWVDLKNGQQRVLASGEDFYSSASLSPDQKKLCWLSWNLPNMPWDGTRLWVADFTEGTVQNALCVAGSDAESIFQPQWSPDGQLYFISDRSGWWNLYRQKNGSMEALCPKEAEFGLPQWQFGMSTYGFLDNDHILCTYFQNGISKLGLLNLSSKESTPLSLEGIHYAQIRASHQMAAFIEGFSDKPPAIMKWDARTRKEQVLFSFKMPDIDPDYFSTALPIKFASAHGRTAYGFYYPPSNKKYTGSQGELPPLLVKIHGGPTANTTGIFSLGIQFWTSRGFAVLDVNYGGSTGYGRVFRNSLNEQWGVVDVQDCEYGAQYLIDKGYVDPRKIAITGGSAGGYTALAALTFGKVFQVGASYYGVSDPVLLAKETHKFEARYLDRLIGPYPEREDIYQARSPLAHVDRLKRPVIFFQGMLDKVVPPDQAEILYHALKKQGIYTKLVTYPDEKHGFRKAENIINSLNEELAFYLEVFYRS